MAELKLNTPIRLQTYRDERSNTQTYQWVMSEYDSAELAKWKSVINGADVVVQTTKLVDIIAEMYFYVTKNTNGSDVVLYTIQVPTLTKGGECNYGGDLVPFDVTSDLWELNALQVLINGVQQVKGEDVEFVSTNHILIHRRLQRGDYIVIDHVQGS